MKLMATRNPTFGREILEGLICAAFGILFTTVLVGAHILSEYIQS